VAQDSANPSPLLPAGGGLETQTLSGRQSRGKELLVAWSVFRELIRGFRALHFVGPCVTVFGSARLAESHPYYALARHVGSELARAGFTVLTGGGPGAMEAANRGAHDVGGRSVGSSSSSRRNSAPTRTSTGW
jgi:SLOG cluster4 family